MRFDLSQVLKNYNGQPFTRPVEGGGQEPLTLKQVLESACLNANPQKHDTGTKKMVIYGLLMKIHKADPLVNLSAEDLVLLRELTGEQLTIGALGAVYHALDNPVPDAQRRDG